jgi:hypothetical protein
MSGYSGGSGHDIFGNPLDNEPVDSEFTPLWPEGTPGIGAATKRAPGGQQQEKRTLVYPPKPKGKKKRPAPKKAK